MNKKTSFTHTQNQTALENEVIQNILTYCEKKELIPKERATLYVNRFDTGDNFGFKTALWINLHDLLPSNLHVTNYKGLWLVEHQNKKLQVMGETREQISYKSIGGQVLHDLGILDPESAWIAELARHLSLSLSQRTKKLINNKANTEPLQIPKQLYEIEHDLLTTAIQVFKNELDEKILQALKKEGSTDYKTYNYYITASPIQQRNRLQAAEIYPQFAPSLRRNYQLRQAVDTGRPLSKELAEFYQVKPRTIKYLHNCVKQDFTLPEASLVKALDRFPVDYFPSTAEDFMAFSAVAESIILLADKLQVEPIKLAQPFKTGWLSGRKKLERQLEHSLEFNAIFNMMQASFKYGIKPILNRSYLKKTTQPPQNWYNTWFSGYGLKRLFEMADKWEQKFIDFSLEEIDGSSELILSSLKWPPLLSSGYTYRQYHLVELTSQNELKQEGEDLEHCVADYWKNCLIKGSYIYSIRDCSGKSLSTFEIKYIDKKPELIQHYTLYDEEPNAELQEIVRYFIVHVLSNISSEQWKKTEEDRAFIWDKMTRELCLAVSQNNILTQKKIKTLQKLVSFTHPPGMNRENIYQFFFLNDLDSVSKKTCLDKIKHILNDNN